MPNAQQGTETTRIGDQRQMEGTRESGGRESKRATTKLCQRQRKGNAGQASAVSTLGFGLVAGSPVCPLSVRPLSTSMGGSQLLLLTTIDHHHLTLTPSNESWCYADPPTPRWHTPPTLVETQALRWTPSSTPNRKSACTVRTSTSARTKYRALFAADLFRETAPASLQACKQCAPNCGAGAVAEGTCRCWQEEGSSIAAAFRPPRAKDGKISPLASKTLTGQRATREDDRESEKRGWGRRREGGMSKLRSARERQRLDRACAR
jgi:hypothetical protein